MSKKRKKINNLTDAIDVYYDDPVAFFEDILQLDPDAWQKEVLKSLAINPRVSVRSGQGVGKTALEAGAIIWFLTCRPYAKVVATAPTMQQLYDVLWSEVAKWLNQSLVEKMLKWTKTKIYMVGDEERWFATAKTATKPENMQGFHEDHMLFVIDEASGVADPILEAILGTLSGEDNKLLMCGNPNNLEGVFYDSHTSDRHRYATHKVSSLSSTRTNRENIEMLIEKYGIDSDVVKVRVMADFPSGALDAFIKLETIEFATERKVPTARILQATVADIGVDVARFGDDRTIIASRIANKLLKIQKFSKQDTMATTGRVIEAAKKLLKKYPKIEIVHIKIDDTGVGGGVTDRLNEIVREDNLPFKIIPINNGENAIDDHYGNLGTEVWGNIKMLLEENMKDFLTGQDEEPVLELVKDQELIKELSTRKYTFSSRSRITLESKKKMKDRGVGSPDVADGVTLAFFDYPLGEIPDVYIEKRPDEIN